MAGINSVATGATHNFAAVISNSIATGAGNEGNFQMPMQFDCTVQNVKVHFQTAPSSTANTADAEPVGTHLKTQFFEPSRMRTRAWPKSIMDDPGSPSFPSTAPGCGTDHRLRVRDFYVVCSMHWSSPRFLAVLRDTACAT